jgi:hypothetical protein
MEFWRDKWYRLQAWVTRKPRPGQPGAPKLAKTFSTNPEGKQIDSFVLNKQATDSLAEIVRTRTRSLSTTQAQAIRKAQIKQVKSPSASTLHEHTGKEGLSSATHQGPSVVSAVADSGSGREEDENHHIAVVASAGKPETPEPSEDSLSWWERVIGRKKGGVEHHV